MGDQNGRRPKWKTTKMENDQNGRRPKRKTTKTEDDQNGRRPKWKTTKMEDDQNERRPKWKTIKMEDNQNGRRPKWKTTKMEDDQNGRRPKWKTTKLTFLVTAPEVKLGRIILGVPWMKAARTEIILAENKVRARLIHSNDTESVCSLQLKMDKNLQLESDKHIDESTQYAKFYMNAFFMSNSLSFKVQPRKGVKLPEIIKLHNATKITLHKGYPRIQNVNGLELPIKTNREFQSLTINVTLMKEPTCQEKALEDVQPNLHFVFLDIL